MSAPSAATTATTIDACDIAWTNASRAGSATAGAGLDGGAERLAGGRGDGRRDAVGERVGELRRVQRRHDAADDGDAERAAELARRVVDGGADVRALGRERAHDRLGRRGAREPHARRP